MTHIPVSDGVAPLDSQNLMRSIFKETRFTRAFACCFQFITIVSIIGTSLFRYTETSQSTLILARSQRGRAKQPLTSRAVAGNGLYPPKTSRWRPSLFDFEYAATIR